MTIFDTFKTITFNTLNIKIEIKNQINDNTNIQLKLK